MKRVWLLMLFMLFLCRAGQTAEIDILVQKLVEKGILTTDEAQEVLEETRQEVAKQTSVGKADTLPPWIQDVKMKGDIRLRYQYRDKDEDSDNADHIGRVRFRLGMETRMFDQFKLSAGIASGSSNSARSTNQTFTDTFSSKQLWLDYAYLSYMPVSWFEVTGGKMPRKLWVPSDLLWDGDINPEGIAAVVNTSFKEADIFINSGFFVLDDSGSNSDEPWMAWLQPGVKWDINETVNVTAAVTGYLINTKGYDMDGSSNTNTLSGSDHQYDYDAVSPAFEMGMTEPLDGFVPYFGIFGEYVYSFHPSNENDGWAAGFKFGDKKVKTKGQWQGRYSYRSLKRDAWFDGFPDGDSYDGDTNIKGHKLSFEYALAEHVTMGVNYVLMEPLDTLAGVSDHNLGSANKLQLFQTDFILKF